MLGFRVHDKHMMHRQLLVGGTGTESGGGGVAGEPAVTLPPITPPTGTGHTDEKARPLSPVPAAQRGSDRTGMVGKRVSIVAPDR